MSECELDGVRYPLATERNQVLFNIADTGEALIETWNDWHLGLGATDHIPGMYFFSTGGDASRYGQIRAPLGLTATAAANQSADHAYYFQARSPGGTTYIYKVCQNNTQTALVLLKYSADMATLIGTRTLFAGTSVPGRPVYWGAKWYIPMSTGTVIRLQTVSDVNTVAGDLDTMSWSANAMSTFTSGGTTKVVRAWGASQVSLATAAPLSSADPGDWGSAVSVGDSSTGITDLVENQGLLFVAKEDNLYEFDADSVARPVLPFGYRVGVDIDNGKGMLAFGDAILYPAIGGLWRYKIGQGARPVGIDTIGSYSDVATLGAIIRFRHRGLTNIGEWIWMVYTDGSTTYPLAARLRRPDDPPGHEFVWHTPAPVTGFPGAGIFATSAHRLVFQSAANNASGSDLYIPLGPDGSPASFTGTRGTGGQIPFGETNFGRPHKRKQVRSQYWDLDSTGQQITPKANLDGGATVSLPAISASGVVNHTPGTNDKCFRYRPNLTIDGNGVIVRSLTVEARTPSIYRVTIAADDETLSGYGVTSEDARANLMKLVNKGLVSVIGPAGVRDMTLVAAVPTAWQGYVEKMTDTVYETDSGVGRGIELLIARYTTDGN